MWATNVLLRVFIFRIMVLPGGTVQGRVILQFIGEDQGDHNLRHNRRRRLRGQKQKPLVPGTRIVIHIARAIIMFLEPSFCNGFFRTIGIKFF